MSAGWLGRAFPGSSRLQEPVPRELRWHMFPLRARLHSRLIRSSSPHLGAYAGGAGAKLAARSSSERLPGSFLLHFCPRFLCSARTRPRVSAGIQLQVIPADKERVLAREGRAGWDGVEEESGSPWLLPRPVPGAAQPRRLRSRISRGEFSTFLNNGSGGLAGSVAHTNGSLLNHKWLCYTLDLLEAKGLIS